MLARLLIFACLLSSWAHTGGADEPREAARYQRGVIIQLQGVVLPSMEAYLQRHLQQAEEMGADLVILEINSPGGTVDSSFNIATTMLELQWAHTVAYIPQEALSGAAIISLGCDDIVMGPLATFGDAGPIVLGEDRMFRHAPEKYRTHLARRVRDLASATGRPPSLAEAMVDKDLVVYSVTNQKTGETTYMSQHELDSAPDAGDWQQGLPVLETREGSFLEVNGQRAVELQLANRTADSRAELEEIYQTAQPLELLEDTAVDLTVQILNAPLITGLILVIGAIALYLELSAPGITVGGLIAGLCFTLFFWSHFLGGTAGWLEVILVLAGAVFLAVELFVIPGFGVAGITGLVLMAAGIVMASQHHVIPQSPRALAQLGNSVLVVVGAGAVSLLGVVALSYFYGSLPFLNRLVLRAPEAATTGAGAKDGTKPAPLARARHIQADVGDWGVADSPLRPAGKAIFGEEYLDVMTDGSFVERGAQVRIIEISGNRIIVREVNPQ